MSEYRTETNYFVSKRAANKAYKKLGVDAIGVTAKIKNGEIFIGEPDYREYTNGYQVSLDEDTGRYSILCDGETYKIIRHFKNSDRKMVVRDYCTRAEVKEHCSSIEASSRTCTTVDNNARTRRSGPWFDGFTAR